MKDVTEKNFGVIIAFWLPGFLFLWGLSYASPEVATWLAKSSGSEPTVGGFLYATLASLAVGLLINAVRWLIVQEILIYRITCLRRVNINFGKLKEKAEIFAAFQGAIENNYRYYQYYSNALVAIVGAFVSYAFVAKENPSWLTWLLMIAIVLILFIASRNELDKFNERAAAITA